MAKTKEGTLQKRYRSDFAGGWNSYLGVRQIKDNESPLIENCDFKGKGGIGNRLGYTELGSADATYKDGVYGMATVHTGTKHHLIRFTSDSGVNIETEVSDDGGATWNEITDHTFTDGYNVDTAQAGGKLYMGNGVDAMHEYDPNCALSAAASWSHTSNGTIGYHPTYYNHRVWVVDETNKDRINFSGQYTEAYTGAVSAAGTNKLGDYSDATAGWISFKYGSGAEVTGLKPFKNSLYVFLRDSIYSISPASTANTFTITQVTNSVGCVSHRSIVQVEEDLYFAADDGVYALGEVANYVSVRTTNKSARIKDLFESMSGVNKSKLSAIYHDFKYHLFYSEGGTSNDACLVYDVRYGAWSKWTNIPANHATIFTNSLNDKNLYIGHPTNSEVYKMYSGNNDNGTVITSKFKTKSFDEDNPDTQKVFFDHTFIFGELNGQVDIDVMFDDANFATASKSVIQDAPQGGFGRDPFGAVPFGDATNSKTTTITTYQGVPLRFRSSAKKFAVQYYLESSGQWRLDTITTTFKPLSHYAFPSRYKI